MSRFGRYIKQLREQKGLLQKHVASKLDVDTPMLSKIERGERNAQRLQVILLSKILETSEDDLLCLWLSDKILDIIKDEKVAIKALEETRKEFMQLSLSGSFHE